MLGKPKVLHFLATIRHSFKNFINIKYSPLTIYMQLNALKTGSFELTVLTPSKQFPQGN